MTLHFEIHRDLIIDFVIAEGASLLSIGAAMTPFAALEKAEYGRPVSLRTTTINRCVEFPGRLQIAGDFALHDFYASLRTHERPDMVFLICGFSIPAEEKPKLRKLIRRVIRQNIPLVLLGSATWAAAEAGILNGRRCSVHWNCGNALAEINPEIHVDTSIFCRDDRLITCPGETTALDVALSILKENFGDQTCKEICDQLLIAFPRTPSGTQPGAQENRLHHFPAKVRAIARDMGRNIEEQIPIEDLATKYGISHRQVERLFAKFLGQSPGKYYRRLQLERAHQFCEQTEIPLCEIAYACGFKSYGTLSKHFKRTYGLIPTELRAKRHRTKEFR